MNEIDMTTLWIVSGILLVIGEMLTGGFFLMFLALGCIFAAGAASIGVPVFAQAMIGAGVAIVGAATLRKAIQTKLLKSISISADIGKEILVDQIIPPHKQTRITYQGASWIATNLDNEELKAGDRVVIVGIDGNILLIRKLN